MLQIILVWKRSRGLKEVEKSKALVQISGMVRSMSEKVRPNGWNGFRSTPLSMRYWSTTCDPPISLLTPNWVAVEVYANMGEILHELLAGHLSFEGAYHTRVSSSAFEGRGSGGISTRLLARMWPLTLSVPVPNSTSSMIGLQGTVA